MSPLPRKADGERAVSGAVTAQDTRSPCAIVVQEPLDRRTPVTCHETLPRVYAATSSPSGAGLNADKIAKTAEFFSYGTNDLPQMTFGFSRDDTGGFVPDYLEKKMLPADPFQILDREGVGQLVELGIKLGRTTRPKLKVGICGEHGGEPSSVELYHLVGMD